MSATGTVPTTAVERQESKKQLAEMLKKEFGMDVQPNHLGYWLKSNWTTVALLAHRINDVPQYNQEENKP